MKTTLKTQTYQVTRVHVSISALTQFLIELHLYYVVVNLVPVSASDY